MLAEPGYVILYAYFLSIICQGEAMAPPPSPQPHCSVMVCTGCSSVLQAMCAALRELHVTLCFKGAGESVVWERACLALHCKDALR